MKQECVRSGQVQSGSYVVVSESAENKVLIVEKVHMFKKSLPERQPCEGCVNGSCVQSDGVNRGTQPYCCYPC